MKKIKILFFAILLLFNSNSLISEELEIGISQGSVKPTPIAITEFYSNNLNAVKVGRDISEVISNNLERSGLFIPLIKESFIQNNESLNKQPRFEDWKIIKAQHLLSGNVNIDGNDFIVKFKLFDVYAGKMIVEGGYRVGKNGNDWRRVSHIISDEIFERITGEGGYFDTRIVYVAESGPAGKKQKRLAIMDQDQANHLFLTDGSYMVLTPRFSPTSQKITYMSYINNEPRVYLYDIEKGQSEIVGDFPGMTFAPRFSPDGKKIVMSYTDSSIGNSEIYVMDLMTRMDERITNNPGIDVSPSFSPDGKKIVFNSNRGTRQHLYVMDVNGKNVKRISKGAGSYFTPVWSPRSDLIAFTKVEGGQFYIGVMETDGKNERMISKAFHVEGPTWSPNGRYLMYYKQSQTFTDSEGNVKSGGESRLFMIDITGYNEREVITPLEGSDPAWSPLLQ
ncbi:MAG: Protein TolB [Alphaproteobacteria bacterium MarineAlpha5_Bin11]|nr:Tol-Pal system beta propeller repeat protein TolB [Pelagibacteraceae bacterium]PPR42979.1 MAG: Protein TolB [Alphaproteobacteria bacterium MarineAlpha5_Bin11]|tara:strand:+ start:17828 stop:19177 length:1350 start_codon:yes stop_codon:yes gene_type:complete